MLSALASRSSVYWIAPIRIALASAVALSNDLLRLCRRLGYDLICLSIRLLHDLVLAHKLGGLDLSFLDHCVRFCLRVGKDGISVCDDFLIALDIVRRASCEALLRAHQVLLVYNDLSSGQRLVFTIPVDVLFDFFDNLLNTAAHCYTLLLYSSSS